MQDVLEISAWGIDAKGLSPEPSRVLEWHPAKGLQIWGGMPPMHTENPTRYVLDCAACRRVV